MYPRHRRAKDTRSPLAQLITPYLKKYSKRYAAGTIVFSEHASAHYVFFVLNGLVKLTKIQPGQKPFQVCLVHAGECFGMEALLPYGYYYCAATVVTESVLCVIPKEELLNAFYQYSACTLHIIDCLFKYISQAEEHNNDEEKKTTSALL